MPEDPRPVTVGDLREFKNDLQRDITSLQARVETLTLGQNNLALQLEAARREEAEKRNVLQNEIWKARAEEGRSTEGLNIKMGIVWAAGGAILLAILGFVVNALKGKP